MAGIPDLRAIRDWCLTKFQPRGNYAAAGDIPTATSDLTNDSGYITNETDSLSHYYSKKQIDDMGYLTGVPIAGAESVGTVKPDGTTITIDADGTLHAVAIAEYENNLLGGES
ncbi:MAG: hypothetical protein NC430_12225 [bacterium]|nr:hypothetical protein [bacterium]